MQKNNANNKKSNESFLEVLFSTLSRIGNVLILAFGMLFFGIKKVFTSFGKKNDGQSFSEFVRGLEDQLNTSSSHYELKRKTQKEFSAKSDTPGYKSIKQTNSYSNNIGSRNSVIANKYKPKKSGLIKLVQGIATVAVISGIVVLVVFAVSTILTGNGRSRRNLSGNVISETDVSSEEGSLTYYEKLNEMNFNAKTKEFLEALQPIAETATATPAPVIFCGDEPLNTDEADVAISSEAISSEEVVAVTESIEITPTMTPEITPAPEVTMDISNAVFGQDIMIHKGDTLDQVALIQERLMDLHYMDADEPTSLYGEMTEYAMQLFQRGHDLMVDGVAGYQTLTLLFSDAATPYLVRKGDYGFDIHVIKKRLIELGYLDDGNTDKKFDDDTDYAIRVFQGRNKLSQDGIVGYNTTQVLFNGDAKPASNYTPPSSESSGGSSSGSGGSSASYDANSAADFVAYAKSCLDKGYTYVWGGKAPPGMDCSGFVYHCLNATGNSTGYMTSAAWAQSSYTTISSIHDAKPGDILCFQGHVAICIGDGKMIDSSSSSNTIRIANFETSSYWNRKWICAKRYFN